MSPYLLDVNVLVAMMWPRHTSHTLIQKWLTRHAGDRLATCPITQAGFVRIVSNPAFSPSALSPQQALELLHANLERCNHQFWPDALPFEDAIAGLRKLSGHNQVTDAYLLGLAVHHRGKLATVDRAIRAVAPDESRWDECIEWIHF